jgi:hypothetical protein
VVHDDAARSDREGERARGVFVAIVLLIELEGRATEGVVIWLRLVPDRNMRFDFLLIDDSMKH